MSKLRTTTVGSTLLNFRITWEEILKTGGLERLRKGYLPEFTSHPSTSAVNQFKRISSAISSKEYTQGGVDKLWEKRAIMRVKTGI